MKTWKTPTIEELDINQTAYHFSGNVDDGFYIGDAPGLVYDDSVDNNSNDTIDQLS